MGSMAWDGRMGWDGSGMPYIDGMYSIHGIRYIGPIKRTQKQEPRHKPKPNQYRTCNMPYNTLDASVDTYLTYVT